MIFRIAGEFWRRRGSGEPVGFRRVQSVYGRRPDEIVRGRESSDWNARSPAETFPRNRNDNFVYNSCRTKRRGLRERRWGRLARRKTGCQFDRCAFPLLFEELEVRGREAKPKRLPLLPAPTLTAAIKRSFLHRHCDE